MNLARLLTEGAGSWLHFEYCCDRSGVFSEKYLTSAIGQILSARSGTRTVAEYKHPVFAPLMKGPGRRPEVDFVVFENYPTIRYAVESKWVGRSWPTISDVIWDIIRLELISNQSGADCFFVLGGMRSKLAAFFAQEAFAGPVGLVPARPILRTDTNHIHSLPLVPVVTHRNKIFRNLFQNFQSFDFPHKIVTRRSAPFPAECKGSQYQVYSWQISPAVKRETFRPENLRHYRFSTS